MSRGVIQEPFKLADGVVHLVIDLPRYLRGRVQFAGGAGHISGRFFRGCLGNRGSVALLVNGLFKLPIEIVDRNVAGPVSQGSEAPHLLLHPLQIVARGSQCQDRPKDCQRQLYSRPRPNKTE